MSPPFDSVCVWCFPPASTVFAVDVYGKTRMILPRGLERSFEDTEVHFYGRPRHEQPTPAELEILKILWDRDKPVSVRDVFEVVNHDADPPRAYTSVMSLLNVMTDKGLVHRDTVWARRFCMRRYRRAKQTLRSMLGETLKRVYNGSASLLVAHLLDQSHPSGAELKQIRSLLDDYQHRRLTLIGEEGSDANRRDRSARRFDGQCRLACYTIRQARAVGIHVLSRQARIDLTTLPCTSVSRKSRPWNR